MLLTSVTSKNNGTYECERSGSKSDPYTLTVLELEPHAQLSPAVGGPVLSKGEGTNLELQVDGDLKGWKCYVLRGESSSRLLFVPRTNNKAVLFAELKDAKRATFWCRNNAQRSNAVTLKTTELKVMLEPPAVPALMGEHVALRCAVWGGGKVEKAEFFKNNVILETITEATYIITNATEKDTGEYRCHATYRYSHIRPDAAQQEGDSDTQELKVIGGPAASTVNLTPPNGLQCSCSHCPGDCTSYLWYHTLPDSSVPQKLSVNTKDITVEKGGGYSCQTYCKKGVSRFSNVYSFKPGVAQETQSVNAIMVAGVLLVVGVLIVVVLVALKRRRGSNVQATARDKDKTTGGDYEQIHLIDQAVYHTLGESTDKDKVENEGGYEALKKRQEDAVYHTLGESTDKDKVENEGGYEALKKRQEDAVYHTLGAGEGQGQSEGQDSRGKGYEQLPQKAKEYEAVTVVVLSRHQNYDFDRILDQNTSIPILTRYHGKKN
ncbi:uncharacterized protein [Pseudorasbora parva]|uniref:uncharacterized protein isoform X1 n=1 Tax=Pseudorasbora parva TaxID=51549 RepID=UPI00351EFE7D